MGKVEGVTEIERHKNVSTLEDCSRVICYKSQLKFNKLYRIVKVARAQERQTERRGQRVEREWREGEWESGAVVWR